MLEGKTRIPPVDVQTLPDDLRETLEEQRELHGEPLYPYLFYARNPAYFRAAKAMFAALQQDTMRVPGTLRALLNRRVAAWTAASSDRTCMLPWAADSGSRRRSSRRSTATRT